MRYGVFGLADRSTAEDVTYRLLRQACRPLKCSRRPEPHPDRRLDLFPMQAARRQVRKPVETSVTPDAMPVEPKGQAAERDIAFGERLLVALSGRSQAWLVRQIGGKTSTVGGWISGTIPRAKDVFRAADVLGVSARWLLNGEGPKIDLTEQEVDPDTVLVPRYDITRFSETGKPEPTDEVPVRWEWLQRSARTTSGLWLADMPSDALPDVAREGDALICQDAVPPLVDGRVYIFLLGGRPLVRKVHIRPEGLMLRSGDPEVEPIIIAPDQAEDLVPVGRVMAVLGLRTV